MNELNFYQLITRVWPLSSGVAFISKASKLTALTPLECTINKTIQGWHFQGTSHRFYEAIGTWQYLILPSLVSWMGRDGNFHGPPQRRLVPLRWDGLNPVNIPGGISTSSDRPLPGLNLFTHLLHRAFFQRQPLNLASYLTAGTRELTVYARAETTQTHRAYLAGKRHPISTFKDDRALASTCLVSRQTTKTGIPQMPVRPPVELIVPGFSSASFRLGSPAKPPELTWFCIGARLLVIR